MSIGEMRLPVGLIGLFKFRLNSFRLFRLIEFEKTV